jgi:hypothetical protein
VAAVVAIVGVAAIAGVAAVHVVWGVLFTDVVVGVVAGVQAWPP